MLSLSGFNADASAAEFAICEGVAVLESRKADENTEARPLFLICGLRNGFVAVLEVSSADSSGGSLGLNQPVCG